MMKSLKRIVCLGLAVSLSLSLQAQTESRLAYRRYTIQDGLPQMQTERLWQDARGYIYIGTLSGFVRFDGRGFTPFLKGRRVNIVGFAEVGDEVRALGFLRQWTVGYDDLADAPLDPQGHWLLNNLNAGSLPNGYVLTEDSLEQHRRLCLMTSQGLQPLLKGELLDEMTPDRRLYIDSLDVLIPTERGLYRVARGSRRAVRLTVRHDIYTLLRTDAGLLAFTSDGIYALGGGKVASADWSAASYGLTVRKLQSGGLIIADEHAIYRYDGNGIRRLFTGFNLIRDVLVDRWDRVWVASYQGVYCFFNCCFTNHRLADESDIVRAVAVDGDDRIVAGTLNGKVMLGSQFLTLDDNAEQFYAPSAVTLGGDVYMPANGDIARVKGGALSWLRLPRDRYQFVAEAWGRLIIGSRNSICAYDPAAMTTDTLTTAILHPWCAAADGQGLLWIGSSSGLYSITSDRRVTKVRYGEQKLIVTTLTADRRGNIFFASADSVFAIKSGPVPLMLPQLSGHEVRSLHVTADGILVVAVIDGLFVLRLSDDGHVSHLRFFNHLNGFTMTEPLKAPMAETADGTVWLPGVEQMTSFRPADLLACRDEDTCIAPPLSWWQHWWVWLVALWLLAMAVWAVTRWHEKRLGRRRMIRLQREKLQRDRQLEAIRQKAIEAEPAKLAHDIVKMTERTYDERLTLRTASGTITVDVKDIAYFKADGNYSQMAAFHVRETVLVSLGRLERMLNPATFVRADRSTLVNVHNISQLLPKQHKCIFRSAGGQELESTLLTPAFKRMQAYL